MKEDKKEFLVGIFGNPNSGKTSIYNHITGSNQKIGNWPGVTVERKESTVQMQGTTIHFVDLPGTYSLSSHSEEEKIANRFITQEKPDLIVNIVNASNLERNLYLSTQLIETSVPLLLVFNMSDMAEANGLSINNEQLEILLGAPIVNTVARNGKGIPKLKTKIIELLTQENLKRSIRVPYHRDIEHEITVLESIITEKEDISFPKRWLAIKLLEKAEDSEDLLDSDNKNKILEETQIAIKKLENRFHENIETLITNYRYGFINGALKETTKQEVKKDTINISRKIDSVLTNKYLGLPIFFAMLWLTFKLTFDIGQYPMDFIDGAVTAIAGFLNSVMPDSLLKELLVDGIIAGVGGIAVFLPNIFILFFIISIMEDSGYMARAAFIMDRVMHSMGLHGKAFIPMVMGFGCNVPAIIGTRILESDRDRILSILINPLMSCSARLPVYILLTGAFFPENAATVILSIYVLGIVLAVLVGKLFSKTILKGNSLPFVMELPPYLMPKLNFIFLHTWERGSMFIRKMGTVILVGSIIIWSLSAFPRNVDTPTDWETKISKLNIEKYESELELEKTFQNEYEDIWKNYSGEQLIEKSEILKKNFDETKKTIDDSYRLKTNEFFNKKHSEEIERKYLGRLGKTIEPLLLPLGIDWQGSVALIVGFIAKEFVVTTYGIILGFGSDENEMSTGIIESLRKSAMNPLVAFVFMVFTLIYTPCLATIATIKQETKSWGWMFFSIGYSLTLAWVLAFGFYQIGSFLGWGV